VSPRPRDEATEAQVTNQLLRRRDLRSTEDLANQTPNQERMDGRAPLRLVPPWVD
jgi:hypothetical protein